MSDSNISKAMSYLLRHGLEKESVKHVNGLVKISDLLEWLNKSTNSNNLSENITSEKIFEIVKNDKKQRYQITEDSIRANQGHSVEVEMEYEKVECFDKVYPIIHATYSENIDLICKDGLKKMSRTHVHTASINSMDFKMIRKDTNSFCILKRDYPLELFKSNNDVFLSKDDISPEYFNIVAFKHKLNCYGGIIFDKEYKNIIIVETDSGNTGFPKGKRTKDELPLQTALREVYEETSLNPVDINFIENKTPIIENNSIGYFVGWTDKSDIKALDPNEHIKTTWIDIDSALEKLQERRNSLLLDIIKNILKSEL